MSGASLCSQSCRSTAWRAVRLVRQPQRRASSSSSPSHHLDDLVSELPRSTRYSRPRQRPATTTPPTPRQPSGLYEYVAANTASQSARRTLARPSQNTIQPNPERTQQPRPRARDASLVSYTSELEQLISRGDALAAWSYFSVHYTDPDCPAVDPARLPFVDVPKHKRGLVYTQLLDLMTNRWLQQLELSQSTSTLASPSPTPHAVLEKFSQLGISRAHIASSAAWLLALHLHSAAARGIHALEHPTTNPAFVQFMEILPFCFFGKSHDRDKNDFFYNRFVALFQMISTKSSLLCTSFLLVQDILCGAKIFPPSLEQYRPILVRLSRAVSSMNLDQEATRQIEVTLRTKTPENALASTEFAERLSRLGPAPVLDEAEESQTLRMRGVSNDKHESIEQIARHLVLLIGNATEKQNLDTLERLWNEAQDFLSDESSRTPESVPSIRRLYEAFLNAFFQLRRPQSGLQVWNNMLQSGIEPTVRTWNVMMKSCHISRDINIMESMWQRMRESGLQPDLISWSTRIYGHLRIGSVRDGLSALNNMGREWFASQNKRGSKSVQAGEHATAVPKPDISTLNTAISALRGKRAHHIPSVLAWSESFAIEADVDTYNMLLAVALNGGQSSDAAKVLQRMAAANIQPNSSTFTILVNSVFSTTMLNGLTQEAQRDKIIQLMTSFEECGMNVDTQGYALLIDRLLKEHKNLTAAQSVLDYMSARNVQCTPHIYTIFMTHYFDTDPPQLLAAEALWNDIKQSKASILDVIFYDRMVEGFARHGDVGRTMAFLNRMSKEGKRPGWLAMTAVVQCLARKHEWDRVAQIVADCHKQEGLLSVGLRGRKGQKDFWDYVGRLADNELYGSPHGRDMFAIAEAQKEALGM